MQLFFVYLINLIKKILIFLIGPVSRAARWQLKASGPPGLQVESYLLQQDLAAGAKKRFDSSAPPMLIRY